MTSLWDRRVLLRILSTEIYRVARRQEQGNRENGPNGEVDKTNSDDSCMKGNDDEEKDNGMKLGDEDSCLR